MQDIKISSIAHDVFATDLHGGTRIYREIPCASVAIACVVDICPRTVEISVRFGVSSTICFL